MIIKKIYFFLLFMGIILLSGCSTKQVEIKKSSYCSISSNGIFVIKPFFYKYEYLNNIGVNNLPGGDIMRIISSTKESLKKYFPNSFIVLGKSYNNSSVYNVIISGVYKTYSYNSVEPLTVFHSPQYFNGFTSNGTYYYGSIGTSSSTAWVPTRENGINILVDIDVFDSDSIHLLHCEMLTHDVSDLSSKDWIDDCINKLASCSKKK